MWWRPFVKISFCDPSFLCGTSTILFTKYLLFSYFCELFPFSFEVADLHFTPFYLIQNDAFTFIHFVCGTPVSASLIPMIKVCFFLLLIYLMQTWFLDQLEEPEGVEEISSSPTVEMRVILERNVILHKNYTINLAYQILFLLSEV